MTEPRRRMKAQDVYDSQYQFLGQGTFAQSFPEIEDMRIDVEEFGDGVPTTGPLKGRRIYTKDFPPNRFVNCSNPLCYNGGFEIGQILHNMVASRKTEYECTDDCQGYEGSPKGRVKDRECGNYFKIKVLIKYRAVAAENESDK